MKVLRGIFIALSLLVASQFANAAAGFNGKVVAVRVDSDGRGLIVFSTPATTPSACIIPTYNNLLSFNLNTVGGKGIYAAALFAQGKGSIVIAYGTGTCTIFPNAIEDASLFYQAN